MSASSQTATAALRISARVSAATNAPPPVAMTFGGPLDQPGDDAALAVAEMGLAEALEDLGDRQAAGALDLGVGIDERQAEPRRQPPPDGRLARPHQPDEDDRPHAARAPAGGRELPSGFLRRTPRSAYAIHRPRRGPTPALPG